MYNVIECECIRWNAWDEINQDSAGLNSEWVHLIAAFALHLTLNRIHVMWGELSIVRSYMTGMHEIRGISNHRSIDSHALMTLSSTRWTLWLMKATCKPLYHNITGASHFFWFHSIARNQVKFKQGSSGGSDSSQYQNQSQLIDALTESINSGRNFWKTKPAQNTVDWP